MKLKQSLFLAFLLFSSLASHSQTISADSLKVLKHQKDAIRINKELNANKIKLAGLENELRSQNQDAIKSVEQAQNKADDNGSAAELLKADAQNGKLASNASDAAGNAKRATKKAKKENSKFKGLNKDIASLKKKINKEELELAAVPGYPFRK